MVLNVEDNLFQSPWLLNRQPDERLLDKEKDSFYVRLILTQGDYGTRYALLVVNPLSASAVTQTLKQLGVTTMVLEEFVTPLQVHEVCSIYIDMQEYAKIVLPKIESIRKERFFAKYTSQTLPPVDELKTSQQEWLQIYWLLREKEIGRPLTDFEKAWDIPRRSMSSCDTIDD